MFTNITKDSIEQVRSLDLYLVDEGFGWAKENNDFAFTNL